jgi:prepilin-type N-terminal cleavage/methylation domain-containing protein
MSAMSARREPRDSTRSDAGFTVIELMVAMLIFSIFAAILSTSILALSRGTSRIQVAAVSTSQELSVFSRLDHAIRYADGVNAQGTGALGDSYFEFRTPSDSTPNNLTMCTQWRYDPSLGTIAMRQWQDGSFATTQTNWDVLLRNVANDGGATYPFQFQPASPPNQLLEEMTLTLDAGNSVVKGGLISSTFVARNSRSIPSNPGGPICPATGSRP